MFSDFHENQSQMKIIYTDSHSHKNECRVFLVNLYFCMPLVFGTLFYIFCTLLGFWMLFHIFACFFIFSANCFQLL